MRRIISLGAVASVGCIVAGCSQITVTSDTLVNGTRALPMRPPTPSRRPARAPRIRRKRFAHTHKARKKFVHSQYAMLKREAARGSGEDLDALAYMMQANNKSAFESKVQANYSQLFSGMPMPMHFFRGCTMWWERRRI